MVKLQQRRNFATASNLLLIGLVVGYLSLIARWMLGIYQPMPMRWPYLIHFSTLLSFSLLAALYYAVRSGKLWTWILVFVLFVGTLCLNVAHPEKITRDPLNVLSWAVYFITHIWAFILLFQRPKLQPSN